MKNFFIIGAVAIVLLFGFCAGVDHKKLGFGRERIERFIET